LLAFFNTAPLAPPASPSLNTTRAAAISFAEYTESPARATGGVSDQRRERHHFLTTEDAECAEFAQREDADADLASSRPRASA
jgi:hypothetical protein